jgi:hypothetical protein
MATYTITDLPRELTADEAKRMTSACVDIFSQFEFERAQPSHVCKKVHGGKLVETPDMDEAGEPVIHPLSGEQTVTRSHTHEPTCHDCGRALQRPPGNDEVTWLCPNARRLLPADGPDTAVECGEKR